MGIVAPYLDSLAHLQRLTRRRRRRQALGFGLGVLRLGLGLGLGLGFGLGRSGSSGSDSSSGCVGTLGVEGRTEVVAQQRDAWGVRRED